MRLCKLNLERISEESVHPVVLPKFSCLTSTCMSEYNQHYHTLDASRTLEKIDTVDVMNKSMVIISKPSL